MTSSKPHQNDEISLREPLLDTQKVSAFAEASLISKAFWLWMNPLLSKAYKTPLTSQDVPSLSPQHKAEVISARFVSKWPKNPENCRNIVAGTLLRCFWKEFAFTAFLAAIRICVVYSGPLLLQKFMDFTSNPSASLSQGYYLVILLLIAKSIEVLATHQFNFNSQKLGMLIRTALVTNLYKKGIKLSCSARQAHGVGQIVNYMAVDSQQLSDMMRQVHAIWQLPFQVCVALFLVYLNVGGGAVTAFVAIVAVLTFVVIGTKRNNTYQFKLMTHRDSRLKTTTEMLNNMRVVKLQAWEEFFNKRITYFRESEYVWLAKFFYTVSSNMVVMWTTPIMISCLTFGTAILMGHSLNAKTVFTTTTLIRMLQDAIWAFPEAMMSISQAVISLRRLDEFMKSRELVKESVQEVVDGDSTTFVQVINGEFSWDDEGAEEVLREININIKQGEVAAVVGAVGSGKSSLLASILGEMNKLKGKVSICGTTAYVAQTSWIQNGTIQDNILFGLPMNQVNYKRALRVCCLEKDLEMMDFGDQTEIGERGINLSGGQKQRIQLARAVYQDCDVYLLDDIFSAVDAHTGSKVFKECVRGALKGKIVILVTHQVDFLHNVDQILVMGNGTIVEAGKYEDLVEFGTEFKALVDAHETSMKLVEMDDNIKVSQQSPTDDPTPYCRSSSLGRSNSEKGGPKLIDDEGRETGKVSLRVYKEYCTEAFGWWGVSAFLFFSLVWQATLMSGDYWLAFETSKERASSFDSSFFLKIYSAIAALSFVLVAVRSGVFTILALKTTKIFFSRMLRSILRAPISFFDTTPSGRILSRASSDQTNVDVLLPYIMQYTVAMYVMLLSIVVITCQYSWPTVFLLLPLGWLNLWYRGYYLATSRELTRLDAITKAPILHHFSESMSGLMTIRCFRKEGTFIEDNVSRVNTNMSMDFHNNGSNEWLGYRLELLGSLLLCASTLSIILMPSGFIKPENVGLSLSYGLSLNSVLFWAVYMSCFVENRMVSVERMKQFTDIPSEAAWTITETRPPSNWPSQGRIEVKDLQVRYRPNTPLVLKGVTLSIEGGEKIGVVGRTGSGKSTLIQAFFRLIEPSGGSIIIDEINVARLGVHDLRSRYGIIPQEPVLFEGTVRTNIDPIGQYSDQEIWKGDTIQATIKQKLVKIFGEKLTEGETYKIRKFSTSSNRLGFEMATYHQCRIWFEYSTRVVPCPIPDIPLCIHAFYSFSDIYIGAMPEKLYIDVIGRLEHVYPIKGDGTDKRRMNIILGNNENQHISCTLFGSYIEQVLEIEQRFKGKVKPTLVFYFVKRSVYNEEVSISTTRGATRIVINPVMNEVHEFNQGFDDAEDGQNLLGGPESASHHPPILASANVKSLAEIEKLRIAGSYVTMANFAELDTSGGWFYNSCKECRKKVEQKEDGLWYCLKETDAKKPCTMKGIGTQNAIPRFQVKFFVMYENHNLCEFIVWDDAMCELLGKTAQQILDEDEIYKDMPPPDFMPLIEKDFIVKIKVDKQFNIDQKSSKYGVISLCDNPRTVSKWQSMHAATKEQSLSIVSNSSKDTNKSDSMMDIMREMIENEPMSDSQVTPQKQEDVAADASDKSSSTKLQEIIKGKSAMT